MERKLTRRPCSTMQIRALQYGTSNLVVILKVIGELNIEYFRKSLQSVVKRHEILRTRLIKDEGIYIQEIMEINDFPVTYRDMATENTPFQAALVAVQADGRRPFDLMSAGPIRAGIYRIKLAEYIIGIVVNHIAVDGVALKIILRELRKYYQDLCSGNVSNFYPAPLQYGEFADWQKKWVASEGRKMIEYWIHNLKGYNRNTWSQESIYNRNKLYYRDKYNFIMGPLASGAIRFICETYKLTPFMAVLAAYVMALSIVLKKNDIVVLTARANRSRPGTKDALGCFFNSIPLRIQFKSKINSPEFLQDLRKNCLSGYANDEIPFGDLSVAVEERLGLTRTHISEFGLNLIPFSPTGKKWTDNLEVEQIWYMPHEDEPAVSRVSMVLWEINWNFQGTLYYDKVSFDKAWAMLFMRSVYEALEMLAIPQLERQDRYLRP